MKILIIGGGTMGLSYVQSFLRARIAQPEQLLLLEKAGARAEELRRMQLCQVYTEAAEALPLADLLLLAVKPQDALQLMQALAPHTQAEQVVLSIMAGISIGQIQEHLGLDKVLRAMPNLPIQIGQGLTALSASEQVSRLELVWVQNLLNTTGKTLYVGEERLIHAATAVSGSGTAYIYYFMQAMIEAAQSQGFSLSEAEHLVLQTCKGAVSLYEKHSLSCQDWIAKVSSRGGTTEAALARFAQEQVKEGIMAGIEAAYKRALELGN